MSALLRAPLALLVIAYQSAFLALSQIWANKLRSILTTFGIIIGVAAVTAVVAALSGLKKSVLTEFETFGTNKIFIFPRSPAASLLRETISNLPFDAQTTRLPVLRG